MTGNSPINNTVNYHKFACLSFTIERKLLTHDRNEASDLLLVIKRKVEHNTALSLYMNKLRLAENGKKTYVA